MAQVQIVAQAVTPELALMLQKFGSSGGLLVATTRRSSNSAPGSKEGPSRGVKKTDAAPSPQDIAAEAAAIYPDTFETPPTAEEIAAEAYNIYVARGGDHGRDADDWYEAERRLNERRRSGARGSSVE